MQRFVKVFDQNRKHGEARNLGTGTQLTLLYRGRTARCSHRRCCIRKLFLKTLQYPQEPPVLESIFKKLQTFRPATLLKRDPNIDVFLRILQTVLILPILKNICKRLLFNFFNCSILHGPKGFRSRLYDGVRLQGPRLRSSCFKSASLVLKQDPTCIRKPTANTFDKSIKFLHWLFLVIGWF